MEVRGDLTRCCKRPKYARVLPVDLDVGAVQGHQAISCSAAGASRRTLQHFNRVPVPHQQALAAQVGLNLHQLVHLCRHATDMQTQLLLLGNVNSHLPGATVRQLLPIMTPPITTPNIKCPASINPEDLRSSRQSLFKIIPRNNTAAAVLPSLLHVQLRNL